jgi:hypothetical protein
MWCVGLWCGTIGHDFIVHSICKTVNNARVTSYQIVPEIRFDPLALETMTLFTDWRDYG